MDSNQDFYKQSNIEIENDDGLHPACIIDIVGSQENTNDQVEVNETTKFLIKRKGATEPEEVAIDKLYVRQSTSNEQLDQLKKGDIVEVFSNLNNEDQPKRWVKAEIELSNNGVFSVKFLENKDSDERKYVKVDDNVLTSVFPQSDLRVANQSKQLSTNRFFKKEIPISKELEECLTDNVDWLNDVDTHLIFQNKIGAISTKYNAENKSLIVIGYERSDFNLDVMNKRINMMVSLHMKNLKNRAILVKKLEDAEKKLADVKNNADNAQENSVPSDLCTVQVYVPQHLIGLSIGHQGKNMTTAREIEGVTELYFDKDRSTFVIKGKTMEACNEARALLEYAEKEVLVTRKMTGKLIGKSGSVIEEIIENSGVLRIRLDSEPNERDKFVTFIIVGQKECVENAEMLFDYYLSCLGEIDQLRVKQSEVLQKLNEYQGPTVISNPPASHSPTRRDSYSRRDSYDRRNKQRSRSNRQSSWSKSKSVSQRKRNDSYRKQQSDEPEDQRAQNEVSSTFVEDQNNKDGKTKSMRYSRNRKSNKSNGQQSTGSNDQTHNASNPEDKKQQAEKERNPSAVESLNIESLSLTVENLARVNKNNESKKYFPNSRKGYRSQNRRMNYGPPRQSGHNHYMDNRRRPNYNSPAFFNAAPDYNPYANY